MNKFLCAMLSLLLLLPLCACGSQNSAAPSGNTEYLDNAVGYINSLIDAEKFTFTADTGKRAAEWTAENPAFADLPNEVKLDGETLSLGRGGIEELKGFTISANTPETVEPGKSAEISIEHGDQACTVYTQVNDLSTPAPVEELAFTGFFVMSDAFSPFDYNGITDQSTLEDVINIGMPISSIAVAAHGFDSLIYITYKRDTTNQTPQDQPNATLTVGAEYDGKSSRVISVRFSADQ